MERPIELEAILVKVGNLEYIYQCHERVLAEKWARMHSGSVIYEITLKEDISERVRID